eukprot:2340918-Amphidinium_carterae.1
MDRANTAATLTFVDVGLATSTTRVKGAGWPFLASDNLSLELNPWRLFGLWKNASPAVLSVTAK